MGEMIQASCPCGYETREFCIGVGMEGPKPNPKCMVPAISRKTGKLVYRDFLKMKTPGTRTESLIFYNDPELHGNSAEGEIEFWEGFVIPATNLYCPNCKNFTMSFIEVALWD